MAKAAKLTGKRRRFADEYLVDLNAAAAYRRAGYKAKSPHVAASGGARLLASADIAAYVAERQAELGEKVGIDAEWVRRELRANHDRFKFGDLPGHAAASTKCLELLGKDHGLFGEKLELSGSLTVVAEGRSARMRAGRDRALSRSKGGAA